MSDDVLLISMIEAIRGFLELRMIYFNLDILCGEA